MTTIEKVARAIWEGGDVPDSTWENWDTIHERGREHFRKLARAALLALASNVTDEMGRVARTAWYRRGACGPDGEAQDMRDAIAKAIRAALEE